MSRTIGLIGVPTSAGAHAPGQEKAPQYLRQAGLVERLEAASIRVVDHGDLPHVRFRPDKAHRRQQNVTAVFEVATRVAEQVNLALRKHETLLVLGGDCTIELGVLSGALHHVEDVGLLYFDANTDLAHPIRRAAQLVGAERGTAYALSARLDPGPVDCRAGQLLC